VANSAAAEQLPQQAGSALFPQPLDERQLLTPLWSVVNGAAAEQLPPQRGLLIFGAALARRQALAALYPGAAFALAADHSAAGSQAELSARPGLAEVMWLAPLSDAVAVDTAAALLAAQPHGVLALFRLIKALLSAGYGRQPLRLTVLTTQAVSLRAGASCEPAHAAVHGLAGSLANEYPHWQVRLADLPDTQLAGLANAPFASAASGALLALRDGQWWSRQLAQVAAATLPAVPPVYRAGGVYVVIGGAGGIGAVWSRHLISRYRARVIWIGRRAVDAPLAAKLEEFRACCARADAPELVYLQANAADARQLHAAYQQITGRFGALHGVVHAAIVLDDRSLANMDEPTFTRVLEAKVATSVALAEVFAEHAAALDFVLFFSSMMSFSTAAGQSNYAAGCTFADAFASRLRAAWPCPVKVINWGYWGSVGTVSDARYRDRMAALGLGSIEPDEGWQALEQLLSGALDQLALLKLARGQALGRLASLAGLLSPEQIKLYPDHPSGGAGLRERLGNRLAALAPPPFSAQAIPSAQKTARHGRPILLPQIEPC